MVLSGVYCCFLSVFVFRGPIVFCYKIKNINISCGLNFRVYMLLKGIQYKKLLCAIVSTLYTYKVIIYIKLISVTSEVKTEHLNSQ